MSKTSIAKKPQSHQRRERFVPIWDWELDTQPDLQWLIDRRLPEGGFGLLFGESGLYKTFVALDLAYRVASGMAWYDCATRQGSVLYVAAEGAIGGLKKRAAAWRRVHKVKRAPVAILPHSIALSPDAADLASLILLIKRLRPVPVLVVVDTVARCLDGDENSTRDMNAYVRAADRIREETGAFVLHLHHTPKKDPLSERGSGALKAASDVVLRVARSQGAIILSCQKAKDDDDRWAYVVKTIPVPEADSVAVDLVRANYQADTRALQKNQQAALDALARLGEPTPAGEWLKASGLSKATFHRARAALINARLVENSGAGYVVRSQSQLVSNRSHETSPPNSVSQVSHPLGVRHETKGKPSKRFTGQLTYPVSMRTADAYDDLTELVH
jgi:hypothetical protein